MAQATANANAHHSAGNSRGAIDAAEPKKSRRTVRRLIRHKSAMLGLSVLIVLIIVALFAPLIAPEDPIQISRDVMQPPSRSHLMGTDNLGRDVFSRVVYGARISMQMGFIAVAIAASIGTLTGPLTLVTIRSDVAIGAPPADG